MPDPYEKIPKSNPKDGIDYENRVRQFTMLTLEKNQALAVDMKAAGKFDDLVLSVADGTGNFKYYLRQCKHKTDHTKTISEDDLFDGKNSMFFLVPYYESFYITISDNASPFRDQQKTQKKTSLAEIVLIKELSIMTNIDLDKNFASSWFDDISNSPSVWACRGLDEHNSSTAKRFKIKKQQKSSFKSKLENVIRHPPPKNNKKPKVIPVDSDTLELFLNLITFEVHQPNVDEMLNEIRKQVKTKYFPFLNTEDELNKAVTLFQDGCQSLLDAEGIIQQSAAQALSAKPPKKVDWITLKHTHEIVASIVPSLFKTVSCELGSTRMYESKVLEPLLSGSAVEFVPCQQLNTVSSSSSNDDHAAPCDRCVTCQMSSIIADMTVAINGNRTIVSNIVCDSKHSIPTLASCKLYAHFKSINYLGNVSFLKVEQEQEFARFVQQFLELVPLFESHQGAAFFFFVVEIACGDVKTLEGLSRLLTSDKMLERLHSWTKIKLILISSSKLLFSRGNDGGGAVLSSDVFKATNDIPLEWQHLSRTTQERLLQKTFKVNGGIMQTSLQSLGFRLDFSTIDKWLSPLALNELILHDYLDLRLPHYNGEIVSSYIKRRLKMPVINKSMLKDELKNKLGFDRTDYEAKRASSSAERHQVHLLVPASTPSGYINESVFLWSGESFNANDLDVLKQCVCHLRDYEISEERLLDNEALTVNLNSKLAIVVDLPGMGKSTSLTHLCNHFLKRVEDFAKGTLNTLILRVNLGSCDRQAWETASKKLLEKISDDADSRDAVVDFLFANASSPASQQGDYRTSNNPNGLGRSIIEGVLKCSESHGAIVMLDGFDEISQNARELIENVVLYHLRTMPGVKRVVVASRPDGKIHESLEMKFGHLAFQLTELSAQDQKNLLVSFWLKKLRSADGCYDADTKTDDDCINQFAEALVSQAERELNIEDKNFLDIPLQCLLFAECFYDKLTAHLSANKNNKSEGQTDQQDVSFDKADFDVLSLYKGFFSKKCDVYMDDKAKIEDKSADATRVKAKFQNDSFKSIERLAVRHMVRNIDVEELFLPVPSDEWVEFKDDITVARRLGVIVANFIEEIDEPPPNWDERRLDIQFNHRTFSEYLFANFLMNYYGKVPNSRTSNRQRKDLKKASKYFFENVLVNNEYSGARRFFTRLIHPKVPDSIKGCPFSKENRDEVIRTWSSLGNDIFNDYLADYIKLNKEQTKRIFDSHMITACSTNVCWWLLCCLKEHFVRKKMEHRSFVDLMLANVLAYLLDFHVAHKEMAKFESALRWFEHPLNVDISASRCLTEVLLGFVCGVVTQAANAAELSTKAGITGSLVYYFGSLSAALVKHQATARLTCQDFSVIVERLFPTYSESGDDQQQLVFTTLLIGHVAQVPDSVLMLNERSLMFDTERKLMMSGETLHLLQQTHDPGDLFSNFKSILELGCPALFAGDTSLFERQIAWFLSATRVFATRSPLPNPDDARRTRAINFLQLQCISYLLTWTYRTIVPQDSAKGDEYLKRIIRQAIRFDVRIPKWLKRVRFFEPKSDEDDYETLALDRALQQLPLAHRAAIEGDFAPINDYLDSRNGGSLAQQQEALDAIFTWTSPLGGVMNNSGAYVWENEEAYESDRIPPAFYLAAAFGHSAFCDTAIALQQREMLEVVELKTFFKGCIQYALYCINDETFALSFLDSMMNSIKETEFYDCFLGNGQLATGESPQVMALKKLTWHLWPKVTMKTVEKYGSDGRRRLFEAVFGYRQFAQMSCPWTLTRYADFFLEMFQCVSTTEGQTFLAKLVSGKYPNAMYNILQGCHNYFKRKWLELPESMESLIDKALSLIWDVLIGEEACLRFVFECFKDSEVCEYSWIAIVTKPFTKYFPKKLSNDGFRFFVDYITTQVGQGCLLEEALKSETHGKSVAFKDMILRVFSTNGLGLEKVQNLLQMRTDCEKYIAERRNNDAITYEAD